MKRFFVRFLAGVLFVSVPVAGVMIYIHHAHTCEVSACGK